MVIIKIIRAMWFYNSEHYSLAVVNVSFPQVPFIAFFDNLVTSLTDAWKLLEEKRTSCHPHKDTYIHLRGGTCIHASWTWTNVQQTLTEGAWLWSFCICCLSTVLEYICSGSNCLHSNYVRATFHNELFICRCLLRCVGLGKYREHSYPVCLVSWGSDFSTGWVTSVAWMTDTSRTTIFTGSGHFAAGCW